MSAIATRIDVTALTASTKRDLTGLARTFETKAKVHVSRLTYVNRLISDAGLSVRGIEAATIAVVGYRPTGLSASTIGVYGMIREQFLAREDVAPNVGTSDALEAVVTAAYRLAGPTPKHLKESGSTPAQRVATLADEIARVKGSAEAVKIARAHVDAFNLRDVAGAVEAPARNAVVPAPKDDATDADADTTETETASTPTRETASALAAASALALVSELRKRVTSRGFVPDDVLTEEFDALAAEMEEAAATVTA